MDFFNFQNACAKANARIPFIHYSYEVRLLQLTLTFQAIASASPPPPIPTLTHSPLDPTLVVPPHNFVICHLHIISLKPSQYQASHLYISKTKAVRAQIPVACRYKLQPILNVQANLCLLLSATRKG